MKTIHYTYEVDESDNQKVWFILDTFPGITFSFAKLTIGERNEDGSTAITYALDTRYVLAEIDEELQEQTQSKEFMTQVEAFLSELISASIQTAEAAREETV